MFNMFPSISKPTIHTFHVLFHSFTLCYDMVNFFGISIRGDSSFYEYYMNLLVYHIELDKSISFRK